ncbi:TRM11 family SAM-dependent methyltransferase [Streptomyces aidingensis]|uniref:23S rRNA G2445 N2-methylase RlmL n=1 Tax=Streptomyces aidingensis TaxID=910347 RepID=A0A1I1UI79_9ACTN|nr:methyltransferase domain-containing protein [Streptomyces aidingensis]SFD70414.1 23S rRNA G2445 N2-methylase RlmL [Streptomyces aidingensis]
MRQERGKGGPPQPPRSRQQKPEAEDRVRPGITRMFATAIPGLAPLVIRELNALQGIEVTDSGFDGRSDFILFDVERGARDRVWSVHTVEDIFVEVGRTMRSSGDRPHWIAGRIWRPERVQRALSVWADEVRPLAGSMTFRVIARVLQERSFKRTDLRRHVHNAVSSDKPKWKFADPAQVEVWISEYRQGRLVAGLRLSDVSMRQHEGREVERSGALRPTVAAAMITLAGEPSGTLLDPCCGSGTILLEAAGAGWTPEGSDIDPEAVEIARQNIPEAPIRRADARDLDLADGSVGACVSNLPFGQQYEVQGNMQDWLHTVLTELSRVTQRGGRVILLAPSIPRSAVPATLHLRDRYPIRLLGTKTTIWAYDRV